MIRKVISLTRSQKTRLLLASDILLVPVAFASAILLQHDGGEGLLRALAEHWGFLPILMFAAAALSVMLGLSRVRLKDYAGGAIGRTAALAGLLGLFSFLLSGISENGMALGFHVVFALVYFVGYFLARHAMYWVLTEIYLRSHVVTRVAIYGAGRTGLTLATELRQHPQIMAYAFLDDNATLHGMTVNCLPVYPGVHAQKVMETYKINRVILAMPSVSLDKQSFISKRLEKLGLEVQTLPSFAQLLGGEELMGKLMPTGPAALLARDPLDEALSSGCAAYRGANVLISGGGGSIGLELCRQVLACRPAKLVLFELSELALYTAEAEMRLLAETVGCEIVPVLGTIADGVQVAQVLAAHRIDVVLHAAAYKHVPLVEMNARAGLANNVLGTAVLAREAREAGVKRFVLVSSDKAVRPGNLMGASKRMAELIVQDLSARSNRTIFSIVRFGNVLGSSGSVLPLFQGQIARGGPITLTDERVTRYFMTMQEAARLVLLAGSFAEGGEVFVLDMGKPIRIGDLARRLIKAAGYTVRDAENPNGDIEIVTTGMRPGEKLHEELMVRKGAQTTAHPKIIRVREDSLSEIEMAAALRDLREALEQGGEAAVIEVVARAVREYNPQSLPAEAVQMQIAKARKALEKPAE